MTTPTQLIIRAQAKGGMFLGPDSFNGAIITVRDGSTILSGPGFTNQGDSGTRASQPSVYSTDCPIVTPTNPVTTYFVVANPDHHCHVHRESEPVCAAGAHRRCPRPAPAGAGRSICHANCTRQSRPAVARSGRSDRNPRPLGATRTGRLGRHGQFKDQGHHDVWL